MVDEVVDTEFVAFPRDVKGLVIHFFWLRICQHCFAFDAKQWD